MKQLKVRDTLNGVKSKSMSEKYGRGYIVRSSKDKSDSKKPYMQFWLPREGRPVKLESGEQIWLGDQWEIWASNPEYLIENWDMSEDLVCKHIFMVREITKKRGDKYDIGRTLQINAEFVPESVAVAEGWYVKG